MRAGLLAAAALAAMLAPLGVSAASVTSGALPHGGTYAIDSDPTLANTSVGLWFRAPSDGYDADSPGLARLAATAAAASTLASGKSLVATIRQFGGTLAIDVYPDMIGVTADIPASAARRVVASMTAAYFAPAINDDAVKTARTDVAVQSAQQRYFSDDLVHNALFAQIFSSGPEHVAPIPADLSSIKAITTAQASAYAARAFRSANATLALAGNVDGGVLDAVTAGTPGSPDAPIVSTLVAQPQNKTIPAPVTGEGVAWVGPPIRDERAATAMDFIADYLFREGSGTVAASIDPTSDNYVNGQFITLRDPGVMLVTIGGSKNAEIESRVVTAVQKMAQPLDAASFAAAREAFLYHLASDQQTPDEQTSNLGWYTSQGDPSYAPSSENSAYWKAARSLDPDFVASMARRYLARPVVVRLISPPEKGASS